MESCGETFGVSGSGGVETIRLGGVRKSAAGARHDERRDVGLGEEQYYRQAIHAPKRDVGQAERVNGYQAQRQALDVADALGFSGPITIIANACASGANSIGHAWDLRFGAGARNRVFTGGYDVRSARWFLAGLDSLRRRCRRRSAVRSRWRKRDGLALGEEARRC